MVSGKYSALSGAIARQQSIDNVSANLANVNTVGYKKKRMNFAAILNGAKQTQKAKGINYSRIRGNYADFSQGPLKETGNPFDVAINGKGFFKIRTSNGDLLTRKGNFMLGDDGRLLTDSGKAVLSSDGGEIFIPLESDSTISIDKEGNISTIDKNGESSVIAQLAIVDVADSSTLKKAGDTAYSLPPGTPELPAEDSSVVQGRVEVSNVNMTEEMTKMIKDNRLYETYHDVLKSYAEIGEKLGELGKLA